MRLELQGFAPDLDPATPGVLTNCNNIIPSTQGLTAGASLQDVGLGSLDEVPQGAAISLLLDGTRRLFVGTESKLYEATASAWEDRSKAGGYSGLARWRFATFGNASLATNRSQPIQHSIGSGNFDDIAGAPAASILVTSSGFVMALNVSGDPLGDAPDGWWCSGIYDHEHWTPSVAAQCANGRLVDTPGPITGGKALGEGVVAYKASSMYLGRYVGPPLVWTWQLVPGEIGAASNESIVSIGTRHFFIGPDDFYEFDGTVPRSMNAPVREWFFKNLSDATRHLVFSAVDLPRDLVYWYFCTEGSTVPNTALVYNFRTQRWGKFSRETIAAVEYHSALLTYDDMGKFGTYDELPQVAYDSPFWLGGQRAPAVFAPDGEGGYKLYSLTGQPGPSWLQTGDFGDMTMYTHLSRVTLRYRIVPESVSASNFDRDSLGTDRVTDATVQQFRNRFDFRRSARWHSVRLDYSGTVALNGLDIELQQDSLE